MSINKRAILSGVLGATASFIGKLALSPESPIPAALHTKCMDTFNSNDDIIIICPYVTLVTRGLCFLCMLGVNSLMISVFLDGMGESGSVVGTSLSTAANFSCSAIYGIIFFKENVPMSWYFGATLIALGMWTLSSVTLKDANDNNDTDTPSDETDKDTSTTTSVPNESATPTKRGRGRPRSTPTPQKSRTSSIKSSERKKQQSNKSKGSPKSNVKEEGSSSIGIKDPNATDVLKGQGRGIYSHEGNIMFKDEVRKLAGKYHSCNSSKEKSEIGQKVVDRVKAYGGRFLEKNADDGLWYEMKNSDAKKKASTALRTTS